MIYRSKSQATMKCPTCHGFGLIGPGRAPEFCIRCGATGFLSATRYVYYDQQGRKRVDYQPDDWHDELLVAVAEAAGRRNEDE